jgi:hypothetical protein
MAVREEIDRTLRLWLLSLRWSSTASIGVEPGERTAVGEPNLRWISCAVGGAAVGERCEAAGKEGKGFSMTGEERREGNESKQGVSAEVVE